MYWYFDFISPFAYLQSTRLEEFSQREPVTCVPILFAGLLDHWGNVGPAEIRPKRNWTFQHVTWLAHRDGIPLSLPPHHPFNPLPLLRLSIVLDNQMEAIQRLFRYVWVEGQVPQDNNAFAALLEEMGATADAISADSVKNQLVKNGEQALQHSIFGVPTIRRDEQVFWGYDATEMAHAHRDGEINGIRWPGPQIKAALQLPEGVARKRR